MEDKGTMGERKRIGMRHGKRGLYSNYVSEHEAHEGVQKLGMGPFPDGAPGCGGASGVRCRVDRTKIDQDRPATTIRGPGYNCRGLVGKE